MTGQPDIAAALAWSGEAARAAAYAQAALRGEPVPALPISSEARLAEAEASPANPYGSTDPEHAAFWDAAKHGVFTAASPAEVAEGAEPRCGAGYGASAYVCTEPRGHKGGHAAFDDDYEYIRWPQEPHPDGEPTPRELAAGYSLLCPAQWGEPPETMLCSLPSGHDGNHATAEGVEWGGQWETAEPRDVTS